MFFTQTGCRFVLSFEFFFSEWKMESTLILSLMQIPISLKAKPLNYLIVKIILKQRKADGIMLVACFGAKS